MALRLLIVDDNRDQADSLVDLVRLWGHTPAVAYDGAAGLRAAVADPPDCLLLDINMPGMDGYALARDVRRRPGLAGAKLVAVTAYSDPGHVRRVEEAGFDYRLTKPADPAELARLLQMIDHIVRLAERTEHPAGRNVALAERAEAAVERNEALAGEATELFREVKDELEEIKEGLKEVKDDVREIRDPVGRQDDGTDAPGERPRWWGFEAHPGTPPG